MKMVRYLFMTNLLNILHHLIQGWVPSLTAIKHPQFSMLEVLQHRKMLEVLQHRKITRRLKLVLVNCTTWAVHMGPTHPVYPHTVVVAVEGHHLTPRS